VRPPKRRESSKSPGQADFSRKSEPTKATPSSVDRIGTKEPINSAPDEEGSSPSLAEASETPKAPLTSGAESIEVPTAETMSEVVPGATTVVEEITMTSNNGLQKVTSRTTSNNMETSSSSVSVASNETPQGFVTTKTLDSIASTVVVDSSGVFLSSTTTKIVLISTVDSRATSLGNVNSKTMDKGTSSLVQSTSTPLGSTTAQIEATTQPKVCKKRFLLSTISTYLTF